MLTRGYNGYIIKLRSRNLTEAVKMLTLKQALRTVKRGESILIKGNEYVRVGKAFRHTNEKHYDPITQKWLVNHWGNDCQYQIVR